MHPKEKVIMARRTFMIQHSLRFKVIFSSILCVVLPVTITLTIYKSMTKEAMKEQAIVNVKKEIEMTDEYVTKLLKDMLIVTNFIHLDTVINSLLEDRANDPAHDIDSP